MKKKLLVVGDSYMRPDPDFPGQHWSEMLPEYSVIMNAQSGASNGIIAYKFFDGMKQHPDAVVLGFSLPGRVEFRYKDSWVTDANEGLTKDHYLATDLYNALSCQDMNHLKSCTIARALLSYCELKKIPYAWNLSLLFNNLAELPYPSDPTVNEVLGDFMYRMTPTNLSTYQDYKMVPGFHTDDPEWQNRFASEARGLLKSIDFLTTNY